VRHGQGAQVGLHAVAVQGDTDERLVQERSDRLLGNHALDQSAAGVSSQAAALNKQMLAGQASEVTGGGQVGMPNDGSAIVEVRMATQRGTPGDSLVERILAA
jgi:hypothetical protein